MAGLGVNEPLIGQPGSRWRLQTPALVIDLDAMEANIAAMAAWAKGKRIALRPHAKTHKSPDVARRQIAAGAIGICCATLGEAETIAEAGIAGVHITSPVVPAGKLERLARLNATAERLSLVADHPDNVEALAAVAERSGRPLNLVLDVDTGIGRTGVADTQMGLALARRIAATKVLRLAGVQGYAGNLQHIYDVAERRAAMPERMQLTKNVVGALREAGLAPAIITGGGTGTYQLDAEFGLLSELQGGSYIFMDVDYAKVEQPGGIVFKPALFVQASVVSASYDDHITVDAGLKAFATDGKAPVPMAGAPAGATYRFRGDEHGLVDLPAGAVKPKLGDYITLFNPHCDPTVNLHNVFHVVRGDMLVDIWPVAARGRV